MHWDALLDQVLKQKKTAPVIVKYSEDDSEKNEELLPKTKTVFKKYFLGEVYGNMYFTGREAEVMVQLMQGKTLQAAAYALKLSPRTIEFYVKNMKTKLACRTKSELIGKVFASDFINHVDFITMAKEDKREA